MLLWGGYSVIHLAILLPLFQFFSVKCSLEGLMLKLKLQYFGHLMQRTNSLEKTLILERLKAGGEGDDEG